MQIYEDIPRLYTALAEWGACLTYLLLIRKTVRSAPFWLISVAFLILQSLWLLSTGNLPTVFWIPSMAVAAVLMYAFLMYGSGLSPLAVGYCCAKAFLLAELAASLEWQLHSYLEAAGLLFASLRLLLLIAVYGICFSTAAFLEKPLFTEEYFRQLTAREMFSAAGITLVVFAFSNLSFIIANSPFTSRLRADIFNIRTLADLAGFAILHAYQSRICEYAAEKEISQMNAVLKSQYDQYRNYQDSVELIHMKYHDLKHQIAGLRAETDEQKRTEWLDAMEEEMTAFETLDRTGSQVLDTLLAAKLFHCRKHGIRITCVADGKILGFMHVMDLCSLFGNALDNAIENAVLIPEKEKRLIHLQVSERKGFVYIRIENYCEEAVKKNPDGLISTTKQDRNRHGFGLKSIRHTAEKYGGTIRFEVRDNWFELEILIPVQTAQRAAAN